MRKCDGLCDTTNAERAEPADGCGGAGAGGRIGHCRSGGPDDPGGHCPGAHYVARVLAGLCLRAGAAARNMAGAAQTLQNADACVLLTLHMNTHDALRRLVVDA